MRIWALLAVLFPLTLHAADSAPTLAKALERYQASQFEDAVRELEAVAIAPGTSDADRVTARKFLAASLLELKSKPAARLEVERLLRESPNVSFEADVFAPELLVMADEVKRELARTTENKPPPAPVVAPTAVVTAPPAVESSGGARRFVWVPLVLSGVALAGSGALFGMSKSTEADVRSGRVPFSELDATIENGQQQQTLSGVLVGVAVAAAATAVVMYFVGDSQ